MKMNSLNTPFTNPGPALVKILMAIFCALLAVLSAKADMSSLYWVAPLLFFFLTAFGTNALSFRRDAFLTLVALALAAFMFVVPITLVDISLPWWLPMLLVSPFTLIKWR